MTYSISIDWGTADAEPAGLPGTLTLTVSLSETPDQYWRNAFGEVAEEFNQADPVRPGHNWRIAWGENRITAYGINPGVPDSAIREELATLVIRANQRAEELHAAGERRLAEEQATEERLRTSADDLTRRLRGD